jgi:hypothetical protein
MSNPNTFDSHSHSHDNFLDDAKPKTFRVSLEYSPCFDVMYLSTKLHGITFRKTVIFTVLFIQPCFFFNFVVYFLLYNESEVYSPCP